MVKEKFKLRRATLKDLEVLAYQRREMFSDMGIFTKKEAKSGDKDYIRWVKEKIKQGRIVGFLIENGVGKVVSGGCLWMKECQPLPRRKKKDVPYLFSVHTEREYRGQGLASRIVKESIKWAKANGYLKVELHASVQGKGVYKRLGFEKTNEMRFKIKR
ncbi:MAG: GNAT family N-acetyltransferase [Candidatus Firestonebacteria bacterium]